MSTLWRVVRGAFEYGSRSTNLYGVDTALSDGGRALATACSTGSVARLSERDQAIVGRKIETMMVACSRFEAQKSEQLSAQLLGIAVSLAGVQNIAPSHVVDELEARLDGMDVHEKHQRMKRARGRHCVVSLVKEAVLRPE